MFHKAIELRFGEGTSLEVTFQNGEIKLYDMAVMFGKYPQLKELCDREIFLMGHLVGSYGIVWNDDLDIEVETIYEDGVTIGTIPVSANLVVAEAVAEARAKSELSQKELARITGIDQSDISKIERGVANPSINTLERLAKAMNMKLDITIS